MKTVIVTGAGKGLGLAIGQRLTDEGYHVVGIGRTRTAEFDALANATFVEYDVSNLDGIQDLVNQLSKEHGQFHGLVNNAGIGNDGVLTTMHATDIEAVLRVNLHAPIYLTKFVARKMLKYKSGSIVNVSSIIASTGYNGLSVYAASKAGLNGFTRSLSRELGRVSIRVNCLAPGYMETAMTASLQGSKLESVKRRAPLGLPSTAEVASMAHYLISDDASAVTGQIFTVDGGATA